MAERITGSLDTLSAVELASLTEELDAWKVIEQYIDFGTNQELEKEAGKMNGLGQSVLERGIRMGKAEGKAESVVYLLQDIGNVSSDLMKRIYAQSDEQVLCRWLRLAAQAESIECFVEAM